MFITPVRGDHCDYTPLASNKPSYASDYTERAINV